MAYASTDEYIARFGNRETVRLTSEAAATPGVPPTVDTGKVQAALDDASEIVTSYIGKRYVTPIYSPPNVMKAWTFDLARERLHVDAGQTVKAVDDAGNRARAQLKDVAAGNMSLPLPEGAEPLESAGGLAMSSMDRPSPVFTRCAADDFTRMFTTGQDVPAWRRGG